MHQVAAVHPWLIGGVALVGAGAIAATPITPNLPDLQLPTLSAVALTAGEQLNVDGWKDLFTNTEGNVKGLFDHATGAPLPTLQQLLVNQADHVKDLFSGNFNGIFTDVEHNAQAVFSAPFQPFEPTGTVPNYIYPSLDPTDNGTWDAYLKILGIPLALDGHFSHADLYTLISGASGLLSTLLSTGPLAGLSGSVDSLVDFVGSPMSGVLWGDLSLVAGPLVELYQEAQKLGTDLAGGDPTAVANDLINDPAYLANAFLNGDTTVPINLLNNDSLASLVSSLLGNAASPKQISDLLDALGAKVDIGSSVTFGGLLSPGGSLFDALGLNVDGSVGNSVLGAGLGINLPGVDVGPLGSLIELDQAIAASIGWTDLSVNPLEALFTGL